MDAAILGRLRADDAHALAHILRGATVCEQHALETGADSALREPAPRLLIDLDDRRHVEQLDGPAKVVERVQVKGGVLGQELDIVKHARVSDRLGDGRPDGVHAGADGRLASVQQFSKFVRSHSQTLPGLYDGKLGLLVQAPNR